MTLVKIGKNYVNPIQVVRVALAADNEYVMIYFTNNTNLSAFGKSLEEVVALINSGL